ncbi:MAG: aldehyde dehydrogenase family protein, partial [Alphaproteobacteria bacterium]|nr:aldehyde dehydrogenase family protein [Alphaproteobacteria bacterium]
MSEQQIKPYWQNYIDGAWVDGGGGRIAVEDPASGETLAEVARADGGDVDRAVAAARRAFESRYLQDLRPAERGQLMFEIAEKVAGMADEIALAECLDNGKTLAGG